MIAKLKLKLDLDTMRSNSGYRPPAFSLLEL